MSVSPSAKRSATFNPDVEVLPDPELPSRTLTKRNSCPSSIHGPASPMRRALSRQLTNMGLSPSARKPITCTEEFKAAHSKISAQLKHHGRGVINPRSSRWVPYWDTIVSFGLLFTALVTPIEVCLFTDTSFHVAGMQMVWILNRVVDCVFAIDCILHFFLAYQERPENGGHWVTQPHQIRRHYLTGWFSVDLISSLPFDLLLQVGFIDAQSQNATLLRLLRTIRFVRLVKMFRILKASRLIARWKSHFGISYATSSMIKCAARRFQHARFISP